MPNIEECLRRLDESKETVIDVETTGLDWRKNHIIGWVLTFGPRDSDSYYLPFRHAPGGNIEGVTVPQVADGWDGSIHPIEKEIVSKLNRPTLKIGHNIHFDLKFAFRQGLNFEGRFEDTMLNAALLNEWASSFSLDTCAKEAGVAPKKVNIYDYIMSQIPEAAGNPKSAMGHYWKLRGDDPIAVEYAASDGVSTWQLRHEQCRGLLGQGLAKVHDIECRLIPVLSRMMTKGVRIDEERLYQVRGEIEVNIQNALKALPEGFNSRSPSQVRKIMETAGHTDWPTTPKGAPSFPEQWLLKYPAGQAIIAVRKWSNLRDSFIVPMIETHLWNGRCHPEFNQLRGDEYGTITGRLSSSNPNLQQVSKRNKELGSVHRSIFAPDEGETWGSADFSQCLVAGTQVMIPGGTKNIENMRPGDLVYSYDEHKQLVLKKVLWAGKTGTREVCRVKWMTNGRTLGHLDVTSDHKIRLSDGTYKTVSELANIGPRGGRSRTPYYISVMALRRGIIKNKGEIRNYIWPTGTLRIKESRFVFEQTNGWLPEHVHHKDGNTTNDNPSNLEGLTVNDHHKFHLPYGMGKLTPEQRKERSKIATLGLKNKRISKSNNNHRITHIIPLCGRVDVFDITVEDTHNFIANEICVHNCEPRLLAYYSRSKVLLEGYRSVPSVDAHAAVAKAANIDRETGKRVNQTLITGGGKKVLCSKYGVAEDEVDKIWDDYFAAMPEVRTFQRRAGDVMRARGYVISLLGRRARLRDPDKSYTAVNRLLQCGNADIIKYTMVRIDDYLRSENYPISMLNNVHDSLDFSFSPDLRKHYERCLEIMVDYGPDSLIQLDVPMEVDAGEGGNWAEATWGPK